MKDISDENFRDAEKLTALGRHLRRALDIKHPHSKQDIKDAKSAILEGFVAKLSKRVAELEKKDASAKAEAELHHPAEE